MWVEEEKEGDEGEKKGCTQTVGRKRWKRRQKERRRRRKKRRREDENY